MSYKYARSELKLLDAIHANSREDGPRLAYADWLERHGQVEYAEFIRLQCEHALQHSDKYLVVPDSPREAELLRQFGRIWAAPFPSAQAHCGFDRGMPAFQFPRPLARGTLRVKLAQAFRYGSPRHYLTFVVGVDDDVEPLRSVMHHPVMNRVHSVIVTGWQFSGEATRSPKATLPIARLIAEAPFFHRLDCIVVHDGSVTLERELARLWGLPAGNWETDSHGDPRIVFSWIFPRRS